MFRTDAKIPTWAHLALSALPFVVLVGLYIWQANAVHRYAAQLDAREAAGEEITEAEEGISPRLMPLLVEMWDGFKGQLLGRESSWTEAGWREDLGLIVKVKTAVFVVWNAPLLTDTRATMWRFLIPIFFVAVLGTIVGLYLGTFPIFESLGRWFTVAWDKVPPLLVLTLLYIYLGVGEQFKMGLVFFGLMPNMILEAYRLARSIRREQFYKAQTLGASEFEIAWCVVLPQIIPHMIDTLRLNLKVAMSFVIAAEGVAAIAGLGFRTYLFQRQTAVYQILPYVAWMTVIMFIFDFCLQRLWARYHWVNK